MISLKNTLANLAIRRNDLRPEHKGNIRYKLGNEIGSGTYGVVFSAHDTKANKRVAVKVVAIKTDYERENEHLKCVFRELVCLKNNKHPNLLHLLDVYVPLKTENATMLREVYFVTELLERDLLHMIYDENVEFTQENISFILYQICCAVNHLHKSGIIHRDLKADNIVVTTGYVIKILDFGVSRQQADEMSSFGRGAVEYRPPELINRNPNYTKSVDIWSIGCIFSVLATKREINFCNPKILNQLKTNTFNWSQHFKDCDFQRYSDPTRPVTLRNINVQNARDLLSKLLVVEPDQRISAEEAVRHPYLSLYWQDDEVNLMAQPIFTEIQEHPARELVFDTICAFAKELQESELIVPN